MEEPAVQVPYDTFPVQSHYMCLSQVDIFVWAGLDLSKHVKQSDTCGTDEWRQYLFVDWEIMTET